VAGFDRERRDRDHQWQLGRREEGERRPPAGGEGVPVEEGRRCPADDEEEGEEHDQLGDRRRRVESAEVEGHAAEDEEERHEEAEADRRELLVEDPDLVPAQDGPGADRRGPRLDDGRLPLAA
jgi:hypothetical protein